MGVEQATNRFLSVSWGCLGSLMVGAAIYWAVSYFVSDFIRGVIQNYPIPFPDDMTDLLFITSGLVVGFFFARWAGALGNQEEWGAFAGGLVHLWVTVVYGAVGLFFFLNPYRWLPPLEGWQTFYQRWDWLFMVIYALGFGLLGWSCWYLLVSRSRREWYGARWQRVPAPAHTVCEKCGLIMRDGECRECDKPLFEIELLIGEAQRVVRLAFEPDIEENSKRVGRGANVQVVLNGEDTPEINRVSNQHIQLEYNFEDEQLLVTDLKSTNKSYINDQLLPEETPTLVTNGDVISLANAVKLVVRFL